MQIHFYLMNFFLTMVATTALAASEKPNIIIFFADDLGYGDLGCYGHPTIRTPHLDQMAKDGIRLTSFYVASSVCSPSRAALITGKYPSNAGVNHVFNSKSKDGLSNSEFTIAEGLKTEGYFTAIVGKWHLGSLPEYLPLNHGFDYWFGTPYSNDNDSISAPGNDYLNGPPLPLYENNQIIEHGVPMETLTKRHTEKAIELIKQEKANPFFLYIPFAMPHVPIDASEDFKGKSAAGLYGDTVEELDWSVGEILKTIRKLGIEENTLVIFTSDNGPMIYMERPSYNPEIIKNWHHGSAGPLRGGKFDVYEGGFRVPAIIQWKGQIAPSRISSEIVKSIDMKPTIFNVAGVTPKDDDDIDGRCLLDFLLKESKSPHEDMVYERSGKRMAYRKGDWKIVLVRQNNETVFELFNLSDDISERYNRAEDNPEIVEELINYGAIGM